MKKPHLDDTCRWCPELVWQYDTDGTPYCAAHARWRNAKIERMRTPTDSHHSPIVSPVRLRKAVDSVQSTLQRLGYAEAFWIAEHLGFEWGVQWWDETVVIRLSDLQLIAFAAAMRAHREMIYPARDEPKKLKATVDAKSEARKKKKKKYTL